MSVLEKIRKLRAVADRSSNEHEVYAAMLAAQRLMAQHDLHEADLSHAPGDASAPHGPINHVTVESSRRYVYWRSRLCTVVADNFRCVCYMHRQNHATRTLLLGRKRDVEIAQEVYTASRNAAARLADAHIASRREAGYRGPWPQVRSAFYLGFIQGLHDQFHAQRNAHREWALWSCPGFMDGRVRGGTKGRWADHDRGRALVDRAPGG